MSDDKHKKGPQDRRQINLNEDYEVRYWCRKFGVTAKALAAAVALTQSTKADVIERYFKKL